MRRGGPAPRGRPHQARPGPRRLRRGAARRPGRVRRARCCPLYVPVRTGDGGHRAGRAPVPVRARRRRPARHLHRGGHRGVRGRDPDGPLPRGRGDRRGRAGGRPREGRGPRQLPPGGAGLLGHRRRLHRAPRPHRPGVPLAARARPARGVHPRRRRSRRRSPATPTARWWPRWCARPATRTSAGCRWCASSAGPWSPTPPCTCRATSRRSSARTAGHADHDEDEKIGALAHPFGRHLAPVARVVAGDICSIGRLTRAETGDTLSSVDDPRVLRPWSMPEPLLPWRSSPGPRPTTTSSPPRCRGWPPRTPRSGSRTTPRPTSWCCGAWARRTRPWCWSGWTSATPCTSTRRRTSSRCGRRSAVRPRATDGT